MDIELTRELRDWASEKKMTQRAVDNVKYNMVCELRGTLGEDIDAVLSGERKVELPKSKKVKFKLLVWLKKLFRFF